ncbi:MAG: type I methionyl aminopeptidase [Dinghuibacter sp.]|nr:type I methionyl aminopeptidase [Dinghuibacter sp.]
MVKIKTEAQVELIRHSALLVGSTLAGVARLIKPGVTTLELDTFAEEFIRKNGGVPSFKGYNNFPFTCCISVNDAVVHGFPSNEPLKEGDIISVDVGVYKNGFHGDSAYTFSLGDPGDEITQLLRVTKQSLYAGIEKAVAGNRTGDIAYAIQEYTERQHGYGVVRELVGHGVGEKLHEDPQVPNYGKRGSGAKLAERMVIAIEPMINLGKKEVITDKDGWTVRTKDRKPSAHFEHTVCVRKGMADILSSFSEIEKAERENEYLRAGYLAKV